MEYGLAVMALGKADLKVLDQVQRAALRTMFSVGKTTSNAALEELAAVPPMRVRAEMLKLSWTTRLAGLDGAFMVAHAKQDYGRSKNPESVFARPSTAADLIYERIVRDETAWRALKIAVRADRKSRLRQVQEERIVEITCERQREVPEQVQWTHPTTFKSIDRVPSRAGRRLLELWSLRRLVGRPEPCRRCSRPATIDHLSECLGLSLAELMAKKDLEEAALGLAMASVFCLGRTSNCRAELRSHFWGTFPRPLPELVRPFWQDGELADPG